LTYYVLAIYLVPSSATVERFSFTYFALVVPVWVYVAGNWRFLLSGYSLASTLMALFALLAGIAGALRADLPLAYNAFLLASIAIVILNSKVYLTIAELNWIFLGCVVGSVAVYALGITAYGFLPGQAAGEGCHVSMNWRVSLFRVTAESAMLSLFVLIANIGYGDRLPRWIRGVMIFSTTYFLFFSGNRTSVAAFLIVMPWVGGVTLKMQLPAGRRRGVIGMIVGVLLVISVVPHLRGEPVAKFWKNYAWRVEDCNYLTRYFGPSGMPPHGAGDMPPHGAGDMPPHGAGDMPPHGAGDMPPHGAGDMPPDWYGQTINRHCTASYQLQNFVESPLGVRDLRLKAGSLSNYLGCSSKESDQYCASCTFATYWLAVAGVAAIPMFLAFFTLLGAAVRHHHNVSALGLIACSITSFGWGGMYVPYNLIFLLTVALPAIAAAHENSKETT
jgi:hypothetical protein